MSKINYVTQEMKRRIDRYKTWAEECDPMNRGAAQIFLTELESLLAYVQGLYAEELEPTE